MTEHFYCESSMLDTFVYDMLKQIQNLPFEHIVYDEASSRLLLTVPSTLMKLEEMARLKHLSVALTKSLFEAIEGALLLMDEYLMPVHTLHLNPEHIYFSVQDQRWSFCILPLTSTLPFPIAFEHFSPRRLLKWLLYHDDQRLYASFEGSELAHFLDTKSLSPIQWLQLQTSQKNRHQANEVRKKGFGKLWVKITDHMPSLGAIQGIRAKADSTSLRISPKSPPVILEETMALTKRAYLLSRENAQKLLLYFTENHIGRGEDNHIVIGDATVSLKHACITRQGSQYLLEDYKSKNGTYVDELPIKTQTTLQNGQILRFGEKEFIFIC